MKAHAMNLPTNSNYKRRKSRLKGKETTRVRIMTDLYPFTFAYADKKNLYLEEATDDLMRLGIIKAYELEGESTEISKLTKLVNIIKRKTGDDASISLPKIKNGKKTRNAQNRSLIVETPPDS